MFLFGINFSCYYLVLIGKIRSVFKDEELRLYFGIAAVLLVMVMFLGWFIRKKYLGSEVEEVSEQKQHTEDL